MTAAVEVGWPHGHAKIPDGMQPDEKDQRNDRRDLEILRRENRDTGLTYSDENQIVASIPVRSSCQDRTPGSSS